MSWLTLLLSTATLIVVALTLVVFCTKWFDRSPEEWIHPEWFGTEFPDEAFPFPFPNAQKQKGMEEMKQSRVVIAGLTKNCAHTLPKFKERIEHLAPLFGQAHLVLLENGSKDETRALIRDWRSANTVRNLEIALLPESDEEAQALPCPVTPLGLGVARFQKMALLRNMVIQHVRALKDQPDYLMLVDTDFRGGWSFNGLRDSFAKKDEWDCVTANGLGGLYASLHIAGLHHYDLGALRLKNENKEDTIPGMWENIVKFVYLPFYLKWRLRPGQPLLPVRSAFGGMAIHKWDALMASEDVQYDENTTTFEHFSLYDSLREKNEKYRVCINPHMILLTGYNDWTLWK